MYRNGDDGSTPALQSPSRGLLPLIDALRLPVRRQVVTAGTVIARAGDPLDALFVSAGAIVLIARQTSLDPVPLAVGLIGYEGLIGWPGILHIDRWMHDAIVISPGAIAAIDREALIRACDSNASLQKVVLRIVHNHTLQLAQSVVANLGHSLERRLSRWLLMLDDRTIGTDIVVTHAQLAEILNVRRATVTDAVHVLEGEMLVYSSRGKLRVRDRAGLELRAGQSYGLSENDYARTIESFGKRPVAD